MTMEKMTILMRTMMPLTTTTMVKVTVMVTITKRV